MPHVFHLTRTSRNKKTGPIPVSTSSTSTCPTTCPLKDNGCYADSGPLALHWRAVSAGRRGDSLTEFCTKISRLPKHQLWRYGQAGDLPGDGRQIDAAGLRMIVRANHGRNGFAFTHYLPDVEGNADAISNANLDGFTINLSANTLDEADTLASLDIAPVVTLLPADQTQGLRTPGGRQVVVCPATIRDDMDCARCGICATQRQAIIGFPVHGTGKKRAAQVFSRSRNTGK